MDVPIEFIAFVGIILGLLGRTLLPYFKKVNNDPSIVFDWNYVVTAVFSGIVSAVFVYPLFVLPDETPLKIFIAAIIFAYVANDAANRLSK